MIKSIKTLDRRGCDPAGCGDYDAPRGNRLHRGIDFKCEPCESILAPVSGRVTKLGCCYSDDLSYRYVEITDIKGFRHRVFYVTPKISLGNEVAKDHTVIGAAQHIVERYPDSGMVNHVHYEIKTKNGLFINPDKFDEEVYAQIDD